MPAVLVAFKRLDILRGTIMDLRDLQNIELPEIKKITERISYVPATLKPLSSDIGIVNGDSRLYLFDVGSSLPDLKLLQKLPGTKSIIISHFHGDHTWWLSDHKHGEHGVASDDNISTDYTRPDYSSLYVSKTSAQYTKPHDERTVIVTGPVTIEDGVRLDIVPLPCTHSKGSLCLMVDNTYAFLGDSTYANKVNGVTFYNAQLLKSEIEILESLPADNFFLSHDAKFIRPKKVILRQLKAIYDSWDKTDSLIRL